MARGSSYQYKKVVYDTTSEEQHTARPSEFANSLGMYDDTSGSIKHETKTHLGETKHT